MEKLRKTFAELLNVKQKYELPCESVKEFVRGMDDELVCVPVVGAFSSGKSAAINTLLAYGTKLLPEDITPETAVPTEIQYLQKRETAESVQINYTDGNTETVSIEKYITDIRGELNIDVSKKAANVKLCLRNEVLAKTPRIMLVDMPGFGSGNNAHDIAINNYAENSMAYIVTFPADDLILRDGIGDILKELIVLDKPICIMITKLDKAPPPESFDKTLENLKTNLVKYIGDRKFEILETCSRDGDVEMLADYLSRLQEESEQLLRNQKFVPYFKKEAALTLTYLQERLAKHNLSESELQEQEELLNNEMRHLIQHVATLSKDFHDKIERCIDDIIGDVSNALNGEVDTYVSMAMNKTSESSISEQINSDVRLAVQKSAQKRFVDKAKEYAEGVSSEIILTDNRLSGITGGGTDTKALNPLGGALIGGLGGAAIGAFIPTAVLSGTVLSGITGLAPIVLGTMAIPVVNVAVGIIGAIFGLFSAFSSRNSKREEARQKVEAEFRTRVLPNVLSNIRPSIQAELSKKTAEVCENIEKQINDRKTVLEKAIADIKAKRLEEADENSRITEDINADINFIGELCSGI